MRYIWIIILGVFCLNSCDTSETIYEVGSDFLESNVRVQVIDTFSIKAGTFQLDSLVTSSSSRILLGNVMLDDNRRIYAKSFLELSASSYDISNEAVYDSIVMVLNYDNYSYGDTTNIHKINLHRITETFKPEEGSDFYNSSSLEIDEESLGNTSFYPNPNKATDSLVIRMSDVLGADIFNKIVDNDINTEDDFLQYFKGLALVPDEALNSNILGFNVSTIEDTVGNSSMRLYYTIPDSDAEDNSYYLDFALTSSSQQFNQIQTDLSNSSIHGLEDSEDILSSEDYNDITITQGGSGLTSRIEIPHIKKLLEISNDATSLSATLTFKIRKDENRFDEELPETLLLYIVDHKNRFISEIYDIDGNQVYAHLTQDLDEFNQNTYYTVDMSGFVDLILSSEINLEYALMVQLTDYNESVNTLYIVDDKNTNNEIKMTVTYLNY